jgi:fermentation-respiration switch protein FrsA (DUF1100 family)
MFLSGGWKWSIGLWSFPSVNIWRALQGLVVVVYLLAPVAALLWAVLARERSDRAAEERSTNPPPEEAQTGQTRLGGLLITAIAGLIMGLAVCLIHARAMDGRTSVGQVFLAGYFALGMLLILRAFDSGLRVGLTRIFHLHFREGSSTPWRVFGAMGAAVIRVGLLVVLGLPFVVAGSLVYRPKVIEPRSHLAEPAFGGKQVSFASTDGIRLAGWWVPADASESDGWEGWAKQSAIICPGLVTRQSELLPLVRKLRKGGLNVLMIEFRAHGASGGQIAGYGALEQRDVLGAVKWLQQYHSGEARRICGVGIDLGGDALIAAAAEQSREGHAIASIATYGSYDALGKMVKDIAQEYTDPPWGWLLEHVALPIASAHAGVNLMAFSPAQDVRSIWPRPILFIHAIQDSQVPFSRGRALYEAADQPKYHVWFPAGSHHEIVTNEGAAAVVTEFFRTAHSVPVI